MLKLIGYAIKSSFTKGAAVTDLRKSFFGVAFYLLIILMLGLLDRADTPIINFVSFFYILGIFSVTVMIFVPTLHKVPVVAPWYFGARFILPCFA